MMAWDEKSIYPNLPVNELVALTTVSKLARWYTTEEVYNGYKW
jgi:hypothetical protein